MRTKVKRQPNPRTGPLRRAAAGAPAVLENSTAMADPRAKEIQRAAFEAFIEHGVSGATTEEIARRARVSKREIYRLFRSKEALFAELVRERAVLMRRALTLAPPSDAATALDTLQRFGREFLGLLTAPTTVAVYRLAVGESNRMPELGRELDAQGRGTVWAALTAWMAEAAQRGALPVPDVERAAGSFMALLMSDLTVRLMLGAVPTPADDELDRRAAMARNGFAHLWLS